MSDIRIIGAELTGDDAIINARFGGVLVSD